MEREFPMTELGDVHFRYLMVDVVVNNVMGLQTNLNSLSSYMFKDPVSCSRFVIVDKSLTVLYRRNIIRTALFNGATLPANRTAGWVMKRFLFRMLTPRTLVLSPHTRRGSRNSSRRTISTVSVSMVRL